jgi:uncharacterized phage protein (TIGR01671 family)
MREIKFRFWHRTKKVFLYAETLESVQVIGKMAGNIPLNWMDVCQYTGLKDKNGTPIYEGDILAADHDGGEGETNSGVVYFAAGTFMIDGDGPFFDHVYGHSPHILDNHTVIGNKFENPELLKA